jgi:hypothetical protein
VIVVTATATPAPNYVYITATPFAPATTDLAENPTAVAAYASPTQAAADVSIKIDAMEDIGAGRVIVRWTPNGNFPTGYGIVWSATNQSPAYPNDQFIYVSDPSSRSVMMTADIGKIYYLRVCRFLNNTCDVYSNLGVFVLQKTAVSTPVYPLGNPGNIVVIPTSTPKYMAYNSAGTPVASSTGITITSVVNTGFGTGKARIF